MRGALRDMLARCEEAGASPLPHHRCTCFCLACGPTTAHPSIAIARWSDIAEDARASRLITCCCRDKILGVSEFLCNGSDFS